LVLELQEIYINGLVTTIPLKRGSDGLWNWFSLF